MIDRARRRAGAGKAKDSTISTPSHPCNTLETLVKRATLSDNDVKKANNTNLTCYLKLGREINSIALTMGDEMSFRTKARRIVDQIAAIPGIKDRGAANDILARAKWVYALFRDIPNNMIKCIDGFSVKDATHNWPYEIRVAIGTGKRPFEAVDPFPCWLDQK
jgi:hypothetical protein